MTSRRIAFATLLACAVGCGDKTDPGQGQVDAAVVDVIADVPDVPPTTPDPGPVVDTETVEPIIFLSVKAEPAEGNGPLVSVLSCRAEGAEPDALDLSWTVDEETVPQATIEWTFATKGDHTACCTGVFVDGSKDDPLNDCVYVRILDVVDLVAEIPKFSGDTDVLAGECFTLTAPISNPGVSVQQPVAARCVLSPTPDWDGSVDQHHLLATWSIEALHSGETHVYEEETCVPDDVPPGQWYVACAADVDNVIGEVDEQNNIAVAQSIITVEAPPVDPEGLVLTSFAAIPLAGTPVNWGEVVKVEMTIKNDSEVDAPPFDLDVQVCGSEELVDCKSIAQGVTLAGGGLIAGGELVVTRTLVVPVDTPDGPLCFAAQLEGFIVGSGCLDVQYELVPGFDLAITAFECGPLVVGWGQTVIAQATLVNFGNQASPETKLDSGLHQENVPGTASWANAKTTVAPVGPGEEVTVLADMSISNTTPLANFQCRGKVTEPLGIDKNKDNNQMIADHAIQVVAVGPTAKLVVQNVSFTPQIQEAGKTIKVTSVVANQGEGPALSYHVCIALADDPTGDVVAVLETKSQTTPLPPGEKATITVKGVVPFGLDHTIDTYLVGAATECPKPQATQLTKADGELTVLAAMGGCYEDEYKPNDSKDTAEPLTAGVWSDLALCGGSDWWSITVPGGAKATVALTKTDILSIPPTPSDITMELHQATGGKLDTDPDELTFGSDVEQNYRVRVRPLKLGAKAHYTLTITLL